MYDVLSNFNKTRIDAIVTVEIAMEAAIDRFKIDPLGTRSHIATIRRPDRVTMKAILNRGSTVQVPQDSVNNEHRRHQRQRVSVPEMISNKLQTDLVQREVECQRAGECVQQATGC